MIYLSKKRDVGGHKNGHQRSGKNVFVCEWNYNHAFFLSALVGIMRL